MQARWYSRETGTFVSTDPLIGDFADPHTHNAYSYARSNPMSFIDPTGMCIVSMVIIGCGFVGYNAS